LSKEPNQNNEPIVDENSIISERRSKLEELRKLGIAFPNQFKPENYHLIYIKIMMRMIKKLLKKNLLKYLFQAG